MKKLLICLLCFGFLFVMVSGSALAATQQDIDQAIADGLAYLAGIQAADGHWAYGGGRNDVAATASAALAFIEEGYLPNDGSIYGSQVKKAVDWIFNNAQTVAIGWETAGYNRHAEDYNNDGILNDGGNGQAIQFYSNDIYSNGITVPVIYALGEALGKNTVVGTGSAAVSGKTYAQVMQDVVDWFSWGQVEPNRGVYRGGWRYAPNYPTSDNSTAQWGSLPTLYANSWSLGQPQFVADELTLWTNYIQNASNGGSGYDSPTYLVNMAKTGGLLLEFAALGYNVSHPKVQAALNYINNNWNEWANATWDGNFNHPYAMWAVYKALEVYGLTATDPGPDNIAGTADDYLIGYGIGNASGGYTIGQNWASDISVAGDWFSQYCDLLVGLQATNGSWSGYTNWTGPLAIGWYINILNAAGAPPPVTPEPAFMLLLGSGLVGMGAFKRMRKMK